MRTVDIDRTGEVWVYRPGSHLRFGQHKNAWRGHRREICLGSECQKILDSFLRPDQPQAYLFTPKQYRRTKQACFTRNNFALAIRRACKRAGVKLTAYQGRHAAAQRIKKEHGLQAAADYLGQRSLSVTAHYGGGIDLDHAREIARRCG